MRETKSKMLSYIKRELAPEEHAWDSFQLEPELGHNILNHGPVHEDATGRVMVQVNFRINPHTPDGQKLLRRLYRAGVR